MHDNKVLLVTDQPNLAQDIIDVLQPEGYPVLHLRPDQVMAHLPLSAQAGVAILETRTSSHGLELLQRIRAGWPSIACIVLGSSDAVTDQQASIDAGTGTVDFLPCPPDREVLLATVGGAFQWLAEREESVSSNNLQRLRQEAQLYRQIVQDQEEFIVRWLPDGVRIFANPSYCRHLGLAYEEVIGTSIFEQVAPADREAVRQQIDTLTPDNPVVTLEDRTVRADGSVCWNEWINRGIFDVRGRLVVGQAVGRDITALKRAEMELRLANRSLRLLESCNRAQSRVITEDEMLQAICRLLVEEGGYRLAWVGTVQQDEQKSVKPAAWWGVDEGYLKEIKVTWDDSDLGRGPTGTAIRTGRVCVNRSTTMDESYGPWRRQAERHGYASSAAIALQVEGETIGALNVYASAEDAFDENEVALLQQLANDLAYAIQALRARVRFSETQAQLASERKLLRALIDLLPDPMYVKDREGRFLLGNAEVARVMGAESRDALLGKTDFDFYPPDIAASFNADDQMVISSGQGLIDREEPVRIGSEGELRWALTTKLPLRDESGNVIGLVGMGRDITERRRAEQKIASLARFPDENPNPVLRVSSDGVLMYANQAGTALFDLDANDTSYRLPREWRKLAKEALTAQSNQQVEMTWKEHVLSLTVSPIVDEGYVNIYVLDISDLRMSETKRERLQEQLLQSQKMEAIGHLTAGIAHDFNNLLTAINGFAELLELEMAVDDPHQHYVKKIQESGESAANLVRQLMIFSRREISEPRLLHLNTVVAPMDSMLRRTLGETIELHTAVSEDSWPVRADQSQVEQVIVNLAVNARDAMPHGGRLIIETANVTLDADYARSHLDVEPGDYVMLAVSDTGVGMTSEVRQHIFEPFFTTKERGKGTGLGLATVYGIVEQSRGHIWVYTEQGAGTTFKIYLPRVQEGATETPLRPEATDMTGGDELILLVEDDDSVRNFVARVLRSLGYTVLPAASGEEALQLAAAAEEPISLLVSDVVIPDISGPDIARKLLEGQPDLKVLFVSGYTENAIVHHGVLDEGVAFLQKPLSVAVLAKKVRSVLES